jgi:hypothetical protein
MDLITERPERFMLTNKLPVLTDNNARVARKSFEAFRRTIHPEMLWNPFVLRITRELQEFAIAYEGGKRPKLAFSTPPQVGKSMAVEDFALWMAGRRPDWRTIYASYSEELGTRISLSLQRTMVSLRYREVFPHMMVGVPGWIANNSMTEFARYQGSFRSTTINGPITGLGLNLGLMRIISVLEGWSRCTMAIIFPNSIFSDGARTASPYLFSTSGLRFCRSAGR